MDDVEAIHPLSAPDLVRALLAGILGATEGHEHEPAAEEARRTAVVAALHLAEASWSHRPAERRLHLEQSTKNLRRVPIQLEACRGDLIPPDTVTVLSTLSNAALDALQTGTSNQTT